MKPSRPPRRRAPTRADVATLVVLLLLAPLTRGLGRSDARVTGLLVHTENQQRRLDLSDRELRLRGPRGETVVQVLDGGVAVLEGPCRNKLCQRMGPVSSPGRSLVCIPNRVRVTLMGGEREVDAITR